MMQHLKKTRKFILYVMVMLLCTFLLVGCGSSGNDDDGDSSKDTETQADTQTDTDSDTNSETSSDTATNTDTETVTATETDTQTGTETNTDTETVTDTGTDTGTATDNPWADLVGSYTMVSFDAEIGGMPFNSETVPNSSGDLTVALNGQTTLLLSILGQQFTILFQIIARDGDTIIVEGDDCPRSSATITNNGNIYTFTIQSGFCGEDSSGSFVYERTSTIAASSPAKQQALDGDDNDQAYDTIYDLMFFLEEEVVYTDK